jgi:dimethylamine/trimethylamine dehydrogenase
VVDYRLAQIRKLDNIDVFMQSEMTADDIMDNDFDHVLLATGSHWRRDGVGRWHTHPFPVSSDAEILTPDDLMAGVRPRGRRVAIYDDDHYYMGGVLSELLAAEGFDVVLITPAAHVSQWTTHTLEVARIRKRVIRAGVDVRTNAAVTAVAADSVTTACIFTGDESETSFDTTVFVTARLPENQLLDTLTAREAQWAQAGLKSVHAAGDAWAPATIAAAVWAGHRYAEELDEPTDERPVPFRREVTQLSTENRIFLPITPVEPAAAR